MAHRQNSAMLRISLPVAAYAAGTTPERARALLRHGLPLQADRDRLPGEHRRLSRRDVRVLAVAAALSRAGLSPAAAVRSLTPYLDLLSAPILGTRLEIQADQHGGCSPVLVDLSAIERRLALNLPYKGLFDATA
jgi:hypothetical protein